jgi:hypothetical protein
MYFWFGLVWFMVFNVNFNKTFRYFMVVLSLHCLLYFDWRLLSRVTPLVSSNLSCYRYNTVTYLKMHTITIKVVSWTPVLGEVHHRTDETMATKIKDIWLRKHYTRTKIKTALGPYKNNVRIRFVRTKFDILLICDSQQFHQYQENEHLPLSAVSILVYFVYVVFLDRFLFVIALSVIFRLTTFE